MEETNQNQKQKQNQKAKLNKTWIFVAGLVVLTGVLLVLSITSKNSIYKPTSSKQVQKDIAHTSLEFSAAPRASTTSGSYEMDININTNQDKVTLTQLEMSYDPKQLSNVDIKPGSFLNNPAVIQKSIDPVNGKIKFWLGISPGQKGVKGTGTIATVSFVKVGSGTAQIIFLPKTSVSASGIDQSVLKTMVSAVISTLPANPLRIKRVSLPTKTP